MFTPVFASGVVVYRWPMPWCNMGEENRRHEEEIAVETRESQPKTQSNINKKLKEVCTQRRYEEAGKVSKDVHTEKKAVGSSSSSELVVRFSASRNSKSAISCHYRSRKQALVLMSYNCRWDDQNEKNIQLTCKKLCSQQDNWEMVSLRWEQQSDKRQLRLS